jgi:hypothetical protein
LWFAAYIASVSTRVLLSVAPKDFKLFIFITSQDKPHLAEFQCKFAHTSGLESTLAKVFENKPLYLTLESTLMQKPEGGHPRS